MLSSLLRGAAPKIPAEDEEASSAWYDGGGWLQVPSSGSCVGAGVYLVVAAMVTELTICLQLASCDLRLGCSLLSWNQYDEAVVMLLVMET
jgi:hypothetical protein